MMRASFDLVAVVLFSPIPNISIQFVIRNLLQRDVFVDDRLAPLYLGGREQHITAQGLS